MPRPPQSTQLFVLMPSPYELEWEANIKCNLALLECLLPQAERGLPPKPRKPKAEGPKGPNRRSARLKAGVPNKVGHEFQVMFQRVGLLITAAGLGKGKDAEQTSAASQP
jgi:hypothetical protein